MADVADDARSSRKDFLVGFARGSSLLFSATLGVGLEEVATQALAWASCPLELQPQSITWRDRLRAVYPQGTEQVGLDD